MEVGCWVLQICFGSGVPIGWCAQDGGVLSGAIWLLGVAAMFLV
jgi:4-hydroxybenzoate polyprenyltransferase